MLFFIWSKTSNMKLISNFNFFSSVINEIKLNKNLKFLLKLDYPSLKNKYIYYPMQKSPESSTLLIGNNYMNQEYLIETISKNIPYDFKLYVKEHPNMLNSHLEKILLQKNYETSKCGFNKSEHGLKKDYK